VQEPEEAERLLVEARRVMERFKAAELRDYFRDECVAEIEAQAVDLDRVSRSASAAVVYPIALPDRLELLLSLPSGVARHTLPVPAARLAAALAAYRGGVSERGNFDYVEPARQLYDWLVRPYLERLEAEGVHTLVFVPDGALRTVPLAALHDGERYLVERYAVAVTPGLSLVDPRPLDPEAAQLLLAGLSQSTQGFPGLPNAERELEAIHALYGGEVLLNEAFAAQRFESELAAGQPTIVHVASHAVFSGDPSESFLLTYDGRLTLDAISDAFAPAQFRARPVELLALSACETALGDERAALGLAGVAIRAGARSALGSLWRIEDEATYRMIVAFYEELAKPRVSKAEALRRAQLALMQDLRFVHPYYWSSMLLISNWL
jgi:CHAT domain-containing protein